MPQHTADGTVEVIKTARELEAQGYGKGKRCGECHVKKLACPVGVQQHKWTHICTLPACTNFATCPTQYKKGIKYIYPHLFLLFLPLLFFFVYYTYLLYQ
jgi:hypothetical protein